MLRGVNGPESIWLFKTKREVVAEVKIVKSENNARNDFHVKIIFEGSLGTTLIGKRPKSCAKKIAETKR